MTEKLQLYDSRLVQLEIDSMSLKSIVNPGSNALPTVGGKSGSSNSEYESVFIEHKDRANEMKSPAAPNTLDGADYAIEGTTPAGGNIFAMEEVDFMLPDDNILQQVLIPVISDVYPLSADDECLQYFNAEADILLQSIQPHESQLQYRKSAARFLKRHIRSALGVMSYEYDFQGINCFLPADVLKISIVLSQSQSPYWFTSVAEKLKESAEGVQQPLSSRLGDGVEDDDSDLGATLQHMVRK